MKWLSVGKGVRYKDHPNRKHGIRPDRYFSIRYQVNGKSCESGLGWASDGWTKQKAIAERVRLIDEAKTGQGVKTHKQDQKKKAAILESQEIEKRVQEEKNQKKALSIHVFFHQVYYPLIQKEKKRKTYQREESLFRLWIDKNIGKLSFWDTSKGEVESVFYDIVDSGKSVRTAEYAMTTLMQIWREAREREYAPEMPMVSRTIKKKINQNNNSRTRFLSQAEAKLLLDKLQKISIPLYEKTLISLHCGLRASEIFNLTWSQIDLEHGIFNIIDSKGADRSVNMTKDVWGLLQGKRKGHLNELVFSGRQGKHSTQISQKFRKVVNELFNQGVVDRRERVTFHTCRHTCASWMVMAGISLYVVQKVLGHSTIQVTERYAHLAPDQLKLAANAIEKSVLSHRTKKLSLSGKTIDQAIIQPRKTAS